MNLLRLVRVGWLLGGFALVLAPLRPFAVRPAPAEPLFAADAGWFDGGFQPDRPYPSTLPGQLPPGVRTLGSWIDSDAWAGRVATSWIPSPPARLRVWVAGYPQDRACRLWAVFRGPTGALTRIDCPIADPHETWSPWDFTAPRGSTAMRLVAEDNATGPAGWLAFSEPLRRPPTFAPAAYMAAQLVATTALALTLLWAPGLLTATRITTPELRAVALLGAGPLTLTSIGLLIWGVGGVVAPQTAATGPVAAWWAALGLACWRHRGALEVSPGCATILGVSALVAVAGIGKASYSGGPPGELYAGSIYRTLAVGDRSDPRIPFHGVQIVAKHLAPHSAEAERHFTPWTFFSRGPLAGVIAAPLTLAAGGLPPGDTELRSWQPFDVTGYAAYRVTLIVLASMVVVAMFLALAPPLGERWAAIGAGLVALCPFGVHEIMFTWPKWPAATWVAVAFLLAHARRPAAAGLALGAGFLFHPLAALWAPWLALWAGGRAGRELGPFFRAAVAFGAAAAVVVVPWMLLGSLPPKLPSSSLAGQGGFIGYFTLADGQPATWALWWQTRWMNFSNTFLPFWLHAFHRDHPVLNATHAASPELVKFAFGWWTTLPLGLGLGLWGASAVALARGVRRHAPAVLLLVAGPALLLCAYWGAAPTGLMRECGHPLLLGVAGVTCLVAARQGGGLARALQHRAAPWLQLPETLLMLWLTTLINPRPPGGDLSDLDAVYFLVNVFALGTAALLLARARDAADASPEPANAAPARA